MNSQSAPAGLHCFQQHQFSSTLKLAKLTASAWESRYWQLNKFGKRKLISYFHSFASLSNFILSDVRFATSDKAGRHLLSHKAASLRSVHPPQQKDLHMICWCKNSSSLVLAATGFQSRELWLIVSGDSIPKGSLYTVCLYMWDVCTCTSYTYIQYLLYVYTHTDAGIQYDGNCLGLHWFRSIVKYDLQVVFVLKTSTQTRVCMQTFSPCS